MPELLKTNVEILISIGGACRTRNQIDNFMKKTIKDYVGESYYFDWLMMGGVQGVANVISRGFEIYPSMIDLYKARDKFIPHDKMSGHTFLHDFGNGWWEGDYEKALARLNENMDQTIQKYDYLGKKTDAILKSDCSVALVYYGTSSDSNWNNLLHTLFNRYKKEIPVINLIELDKKAPSVNGIYTAFVDDTNSPKRGQPKEWEGWDESWYQALGSLQINKRKSI